MFVVCPGSIGLLLVERLSVPNTTPKELGPFRDGDVRRDLFRQEAPELRMMPAQFVPRAVPMRADSGAEPTHFLHQGLAGHCVHVFVHGGAPSIPLNGASHYQNLGALRRQG
jgi:hypothetical protein